MGQENSPAQADKPANTLRVVIVAYNASTRYGGESVLPVHYFRALPKLGHEAWLVTHARNRDGLYEQFPDRKDHMHFVEDTRVHVLLARISAKLPRQIAMMTSGFLLYLLTMRRIRQIAKRLIADHDIDIAHEPMPVSPKGISLVHGLGVPVVIGSMNGGMSYPPAFAHFAGRFEALAVRGGRFIAPLVHRVFPGKRRAAALVAANRRTRNALPVGDDDRIHELVENGIDLSVWQPPDRTDALTDDGVTRFVFVGRLVKLKTVDVLIDAVNIVSRSKPVELHVIGNGPELETLRERARATGAAERVVFHGFLPQQACAKILARMDALLLSSVHECGGAVILEAMAMSMPTIVTNWGGPADYVDDTCGILIDPVERSEFVKRFADAMIRLAEDPELRRQLGRSGRKRVEQVFDWDRKIERMADIYREAIRRGNA